MDYQKQVFKKEVFGELAEVILAGGARKATKFLSERLTVKVTRRHKIDRRSRITEILFTVGGPNYAEREFIKKAKKAGEPFPIKKILIEWPKKKPERR